MDLPYNYIVETSPKFEKELDNIYHYLSYVLDIPNIARSFYFNIIKNVFSLAYFPQRFLKIPSSNYKNLRKMSFKNFIIIYEVDNYTSKVSILHIFYNKENYFNKL